MAGKPYPTEPEAEWKKLLLELNCHDLLAEALSRKLTDKGFWPAFEVHILAYRQDGYRNEREFWEAHQLGLPFGQTGGSLRELEEKYGIDRETLRKRRKAVMG